MHRTHTRPARDLRDNYEDILALVRQRDYVIIIEKEEQIFAMISIEDFKEFLDKSSINGGRSC